MIDGAKTKSSKQRKKCKYCLRHKAFSHHRTGRVHADRKAVNAVCIEMRNLTAIDNLPNILQQTDWK